MATNRVYAEAHQLSLTVPAGTSSGDPVAVGQIPGVALIDADANNKATVQMDGAFDLPVLGNNGTADAAVAEGDIVYIAAGAISNDSTGVRFGYALAPVAAGATTTVPVKIGY